MVRARRSARVPLRIHQDIVLNRSTLVESDAVLVLPAATRYEQRGGGTSTTTERRVRFSPEIPGRRIGEARAEWEILAAIGRAALDEPRRAALGCDDAQRVRDEMERVMPLYRGIGGLRRRRRLGAVRRAAALRRRRLRSTFPTAAPASSRSRCSRPCARPTSSSSRPGAGSSSTR